MQANSCTLSAFEGLTHEQSMQYLITLKSQRLSLYVY